jgi:hypothetical protein
MEEQEGILCPGCNKWRPKAYCPWCGCATKGYVTQERFDQEEISRSNAKQRAKQVPNIYPKKKA